MAKIEAYWDCPYCGNKAIRGREHACPACGKTRAQETRFYMLDKTHVADESAVEAGPDWLCPYCDSYNPSSARFCQNCGHPRDAEDRDYFAVRQEEERKKREQQAELDRVSGTQPAQPKKRSRLGRFIALGLAAVLLIALVIGVMPHSRGVTVTQKDWERSVEVLENRLVEENGWELPADAVEVLHSGQEIHHYDQILDHYETRTVTRSREVLDGYDTYTTYNDLGNGYFEEEVHEVPRYVTEYYDEEVEEPVYVSVPVFGTKYYYTVYEWVYDRTETASGTNTEPYWPDIQYAADEREGDRSEEYTVVCADKKGQQKTYDCEYGIWETLDTGGSYKIQTHSGRIVGLK